MIPFFSNSSIGGLFEISLRNLSLIFVLLSSLSLTEMILRANFVLKYMYVTLTINPPPLLKWLVLGHFCTHTHTLSVLVAD